MIFVTVGTSWSPFDRLLKAVDHLPVEEDLIVQYGASAIRPRRASCYDFLPFSAVVDYVRRSRLVITHAGVGSVMVALANGQRPLVLPRRQCFGEAVDDHQVPLARRLEEARLITLLDNEARLVEALATEAEGRSTAFEAHQELIDDLAEYLATHLGRRVKAAAAGP